MLKRSLSSLALIGLFYLVLFQMHLSVFCFLVVALVPIALYEFLTMIRFAQVPVYRLFSIVMGTIIPLVVTFQLGTTQSGEVLFLVFGSFCLFVLQFTRKDDPRALLGIALTVFGVLYVSWFPSFLIKIRYLEHGEYWVAYLLIVTKSQDIGAYLVGSSIGKHALIPHISPKKTLEGAIGGLLFSMGAAFFLRTFTPISFSVLHALIAGLAIAVVGQVGDLAESLIKRFCHQKDSGKLFPGMGGLLDVTDSILFTAPLFYFHIQSLL